MTGPKHLWSGDWERESAATSGAEADRRQDHEDPTAGGNAATSPAREPETTAPTRRRRNRIAVATTLALLVIAGIAIAATSAGSDPTRATAPTAAAAASPTNPTPAQPTTPNPTNPNPTNPSPAIPTPAIPTPTNPNPSTPNPATPLPPAPTSSTATTPTVAPQPVNWLGMEIITIPSGAAVIDTVSPGGAGDRAGLTPADTITQIDNHAVTGSTSIARAVRGKHRGDSVTVTVVRGGTSLDVQTTFTGPPTAYP